MFTGIIEEVGTLRSIRHERGSARLSVAAQKVLEGTRIGDSIAVNGVCLTVTDIARGWFTADAMPETLRRTSLADLRPGGRVNLERAMQAGGRFGGHIVSGHVDVCGRVISIAESGIARIIRIGIDPTEGKESPSAHAFPGRGTSGRSTFPGGPSSARVPGKESTGGSTFSGGPSSARVPGEESTDEIAFPGGEGPGGEVLGLIAVKGSVAVDGASLTVTDVDSGSFAVSLIPHTLSASTLGSLRPGDKVNVEADLIARYVARALACRDRDQAGVTAQGKVQERWPAQESGPLQERGPGKGTLTLDFLAENGF